MTLMQRRRALMGAKNPVILFSWVPANGLSGLDFDGTSTVAPYISDDALVLTGGTDGYVKTRKIYTPSQIITGANMTVLCEYTGLYSSTYYHAIQLRLYFSRISVDFVIEIDGTNHKAILYANAVAKSTVTLSGNIDSGTMKIVWDAENKSAEFYLNDNLIGSVTPSATTTTDRGIILAQGRYNSTVKIKKILAVKGKML